MMVKSKKYVTGKRQEITIKNENEGMRKKILSKKVLNTIRKNKEKSYTIETKFD